MTASRARVLSPEWPFPGLRPFDFRDAKFFFGRDQQKYALYRMLDRNRFVAVVGSSGSGKSSLVFAALLPYLAEENKEFEARPAGAPRWAWTVMRPGRTPLAHLATALAGLLPDADEEVAAGRHERIAYYLRRSSYGIVEALQEMRSADNAQLIIVVDQFEELFRFASPERSPLTADDHARSMNEAEQFVQLLIQASRSSEREVQILITMRSDFIGDCSRFQGLPELVSAAQFLVPGVSRDQREEVIRKPLVASGSSIDPDLVTSLLNDSVSELDQLPVLQHCMLRLWEKAAPSADAARPDGAPDSPAASIPRHLVLTQYTDIGGISGALSQHADEILDNLEGHDGDVAKVFRALAEIDREGRFIRRNRVSFGQLKAETGMADADLRLVLDRFRADDCSFLSPSISAQKLIDETWIDVSHEALLRRWTRIRGDRYGAKGWLRAEEEDGQYYRYLLRAGELSAAAVKEADAWWEDRNPTEAWTERYGGHRGEVKEMLRKSLERRKRAIRMKVAIPVAIVLALLALVGFFQHQISQQREAASLQLSRQRDEASLRTVRSARSLIDAVQTSLNRGIMPPMEARNLLESATKIAFDVQLSATPQVLEIRGEIRNMMADTYYDLKDTTSALQNSQQAEAIADSLISIDRGNEGWQRLRYRALFRIGDNEDRQANAEKDKEKRAQKKKSAADHYRAALAIVDAIFKNKPDDAELGSEVAFIYGKLGDLALENNLTQEGRQNYEKAAGIMEPLHAKYPDNKDTTRDLASFSYSLAETQTDDTQKLALHRKALALRQDLLKKEPRNATYLNHAVRSLTKVASLLMVSDPQQAIGYLREIAADWKIATDSEQLKNGQANWAAALEKLGDALKQTGSDEAPAVYKQALEIREALVGADPGNAGLKKSRDDLEKKMKASAPL